MRKPIFYCCEGMDQAINHGDNVYYNAVFDEYGLPIPDDRNSLLLIQYCPFCGKKLPESKRETWFARLEKLGFGNPLFRTDLPQAYRCADWWKRENNE